jgi:hypothetical protein
MPLSSGEGKNMILSNLKRYMLKLIFKKNTGKWPGEYGVGIKEDRLAQSTKCAICTQKGCFKVKYVKIFYYYIALQ